MTRSSTPVPPPPAAPPRGRRALAIAASAAVALGAALAGPVAAQASPATGDPAVTRAALDPALVMGRGADVAFLEQEAEHAVTNGEIIGPDRTAYTLPAEASGRSAVLLEPGEHVEFTLPAAANAITVRYSIPDAPDGGGIRSTLDVTVDGGEVHAMELTSEYSWLYNQYPFTNDPNAQLLHPDWWITECACVPGEDYVVETPFRPMHFYDEQRMLLDATYPAGSVVRLTAPVGADAAWTVIDLLDSELVAPPLPQPDESVSVTKFGADPTGVRDAAPAFRTAIRWAKRHGVDVFIPAGEFRVSEHLIVDDVTIRGAGNWHSIVFGEEVALHKPAADGSVHTGVGFYGKDAAEGGSTNVHLSDFSIRGDVRERIDTDQVNGVGGAMSDSTIERLHIEHTKVGLWFDGPMDGVVVRDNVIVDQIADGLNFHTGVTNSVAEGNFVRNSGDDGLAMWAQGDTNAGNAFVGNTVQSPSLANGIAIYGGEDITVEGNLVADPVREGSALHAGARFGAEPFTGTLAFTDNTTVRAGTYELNWNIGLGAIWFYALDRSIDRADVRVTGDHYLDSTYNAIMLVSDWPVKDQVSISGVHFADVRVDGTGTSVVSARVSGSASFENVDARNVGAVGVNNCGSFNFPPTGSEFSLVDLGGNDSSGVNTTGPWMAPWVLPNTITCDDRPPVVAPPAPSAW